MKTRYHKVVTTSEKNRISRQSRLKQFQQTSFNTQELIRLQRKILKFSSSPQMSYSDRLLLDYSNPAMNGVKVETYDPRFKVDYLLHNLFRKILLPTTDVSALDRAALNSFFKGERTCLRTNRRMQSYPRFDEELHSFVIKVQDMIRHILGPLALDQVLALSKFSQGATFDLPLMASKSIWKYNFDNPSCTLETARSLAHYLNSDNGITGIQGPLQLCRGNRVLTVPKSNTTNRTIAAEPTLNMFFQLGVGRYMKRRLRRFGVDLSDQTKNQRLALSGSIDGKLATIDLENASNSLAYETVKLLLPSDWFALLDTLRSPEGKLPNGKFHKYRMFSSMGNGFTFELESLIFYCISKVASGELGSEVSVYGDDIICSSSCSTEVIRWLSFFGFKTNNDKTFTTGYFRESCGKHYYFGEDVSPFFVRKIPSSFDCFLLHNNIVRWMQLDGYEDIRLAEAREYVLSLLPEDSRIFGPDGMGDGHLLNLESDSYKPRLKYSRALGGLTFKSFIRSPSSYIYDGGRGALCASLLGGTKNMPLSSYPSNTEKVVLAKMSTEQRW